MASMDYSDNTNGLKRKRNHDLLQQSEAAIMDNSSYAQQKLSTNSQSSSNKGIPHQSSPILSNIRTEKTLEYNCNKFGVHYVVSAGDERIEMEREIWKKRKQHERQQLSQGKQKVIMAKDRKRKEESSKSLTSAVRLIEQNAIQSVKDGDELLKERMYQMKRVVIQLHQSVTNVKVVMQVADQSYKTNHFHRLNQKKNVYQK